MTIKRLSQDQFDRITQLPSVSSLSEQTLTIAHRCLVKGEQQSTLMGEYNVTRAAISQAVLRVWNACPPGYEFVTALVTEDQALQIKKWEREASKAIKG
ncbi:transcriptional regulator [Pseudomonas sp. WS 5096]|uniref:Transcriptional regulator n=1 Tax=Pseudomonas cremoris TaxID=2724178 RepID=A0ABR6TH48_9PSED|nr:TrfB-related DNA-binding protein [Pseudomonas cremoris]MBC2385307.1 transcriptional regulator [Pseudomonas cremoris]